MVQGVRLRFLVCDAVGMWVCGMFTVVPFATVDDKVTIGLRI